MCEIYYTVIPGKKDDAEKKIRRKLFVKRNPIHYKYTCEAPKGTRHINKHTTLLSNTFFVYKYTSTMFQAALLAFKNKKDNELIERY